MSDSNLVPSQPIGIPQPGRYGRSNGIAGVDVGVLDLHSICTIQPQRNESIACSAILKGQFGVEIPPAGRACIGADLTLAWGGPEAFVAVSSTSSLVARVRKALDGMAAVVDQSDGRLLVRVSGPCARATLEKGTTIDLHSRAFSSGHSAMTLLSHLAVQIIQTNEAPVYDILLSRAYSADFWHWIESSAAEFGLELSDIRR